MCGFFGEVRYFEGAEPPTMHGSLRAILECLAHRGPDADGSAEVGGPGWVSRFVHARLKIIDLTDAGAQPMVSANGRHLLVFNGEIYNYRDLREDLKRTGHRFKSESDTEVLLAALQEWGEQAIPLLDGMFAFALLDRRDGSLLLARDAFGIKPAYWRQAEGGVAFASELRCLSRAMGTGAKIDAEGMASFLAYGSVCGPNTILKGTRELLPGHLLRVSRSRVDVERWYSLPRGFERSGITREEAARTVHELLQDSVARQLVSDVPIGAFLSGGMDSNALVALAARTHGRSLSTITVAFDERLEGLSEESQASAFAKNMGVRHEVVRLKERWILDSLDDVIGHMDQPSIDGVNTWAVSQAVKAHGISVALSGLGGDEVFGGYAHLRSGHEHRLVYSALKSGGAASALGSAILSLFAPDSVSARKVVALLRHVRKPGGVYAVRRALFLPEDSMTLVTPDVQHHWSIAGLEGMLRGTSELDGPLAQESTLLEFQNYLPFTLLRDTDVMSMAHALEVRVPFLDVALVNFVLSLPLEHRFQNGRQKPLLAAAVPEISEAGRSKKMGFTLPFAEWLRGPLREIVNQRLRRLTFAGAWVQPGPAAKLFDRFLAGEERLWTRVWGIYVLDSWLETMTK